MKTFSEHIGSFVRSPISISMDFVLLNLSMMLIITTQSDFFNTQQAKYFISIFFSLFLFVCLIFKLLIKSNSHINILKIGFPFVFTLTYFETFGFEQTSNPFILLNFLLYNILAVSNNSSNWIFSLEIPFFGIYYFLRIVSEHIYSHFDIFPFGAFYLGMFFSAMTYKKKCDENKMKNALEENEIYKNLFLKHYPGKFLWIKASSPKSSEKSKKWVFQRLIKFTKKNKKINNENVKIQINSTVNSKTRRNSYSIKEYNKAVEEMHGELIQNPKKLEEFLEKLKPADLCCKKCFHDFNSFIQVQDNEDKEKSTCTFLHSDSNESIIFCKINYSSFLLISEEPVPHSANLFSNNEVNQHKINQIEDLKKTIETKDRILAAVSHDMRSPLNGIIYYIKSAKDSECPNMRQQKLDFALTNANLLLFLVNDFLDFSLFSNNNTLKLNPSKFALTNLLNDVLSLVRMEAQNKGIILFLKNECNPNLLLFSDERRMKQVLLNLLTNAIKFTFEGYVKLLVSMVSGSKNLIRFEINDTGMGIKPEVIPNLMKPFSTFDNEKKANRSGIGLGLYICKTIVGILGPESNIFIHSEEGKGTQMGFLAFIMNESQEIIKENLDAIDFNKIFEKNIETFKEENALESDHREFTIKTQNINKNSFYNKKNIFSAFSPKKNNTGLSTEKKKFMTLSSNIMHTSSCSDISYFVKGISRSFNSYPILIVDDQTFNLMILNDILLSFKDKNIVVESALNGSIAVDMFCRRNDPMNDDPYVLIFMDKEMPIMSGIDATKIIRNKIFKEAYKDVRIIGCSGDAFGGETEKNEFIGLDECFVKPVDVEKIHSCLRKYLGGKN